MNDTSRPSKQETGSKDSDAEKRPNRWLPIAGLAFGVAGLVFIIYFVGLEAILEPLRKIGFGFLWIVILNGVRHLLRAANMYIAVPRADRTFTFANAFAARLAGETINTIAFTGPLFGDAAKAAILERKVPIEVSATAVIVDEIIYYVSSLLLILAGAIVVLYFYGSGTTLTAMLVALVILSVALLAGIWSIVRNDFKPVSWLIKKSGDRWFMPKFLRRRRDSVYEVECNVVKFHDERPRAFAIIVGITLITHFLSVLEAYVAMKMLGLEVTVTSAFIIESLTKAVNFIFFLIPGTIGAYEGGNSLILTLLGFSAGAGVALALVRRGGILFWTLIGGIVLLWRGAKSGAEQLAEDDGE